MEYAGFAMLAAVAVAMLTTGLPAWAAMIGVATVFAAIGVAAGAMPLVLLNALPSRLIGLLETDLLQALPLYVFMGALLNTLPLAGWIFQVLARLSGRSAAAPLLAGLGLGALLAPMNGSAGSSVAMIARVTDGPFRDHAVPPERQLGLVCAASVLGVVIPPSLVLILLGDAMMRAHTEALNTTHRFARVINTQDLFHGALVPAGLLFALFLAIVWARSWRRPATPIARPRLPFAAWAGACLSVLAIGGLLTAVATGRMYAVEAAATGAACLALFGLTGGRLRGAALRGLLTDTMALSGALFALFAAATTFTLVFRGFGTDRLLAAMVTGAPCGAIGATILVLGLIAASALVLDAFEIILVVVPLLLPPLLVRSPDAVWNAVLVLLVLQASFLLPPFGYAVMLARSRLGAVLSARRVTGAVAPFLAAQILVLALAVSFPWLVRPFGVPEADTRPALSDDAARELLRGLPPPPEPDD